MLFITCKDNILHVKETIMSFSGTSIYHWYYDVEANTRSVNGKEGDTPIQPMIDAEIDWMHRHYIPRAIEENTEQ